MVYLVFIAFIYLSVIVQQEVRNLMRISRGLYLYYTNKQIS